MKKPELLSPVGNWAMLRAAVDSGCDSVYFGIKGLNMRASAQNFELKDLRKIAKEPVKKYLALNTTVFDDELPKIRHIIEKAYSAGIDAIICWDLAVLQITKDIGLNAHISTQASIANTEALKLLKKLGVARVIMARELNMEQLKQIKKETDIELECFIHGAMCVALSGRCFMSHEMFGKSANRGECLQSCRREYLIKDMQDGKELVLGSNYVLSAKDLCTLPFLDKLMFLDAFKIEGRTRSPEYVKIVTECYRKAIDSCFGGDFTEKLKKELVDKLKTVYNRGFSNGFYLGLPTSNDFATIEGSAATRKKLEIGKVTNFYKNKGVMVARLIKDVKVGDDILIIGNKTGVVEQQIKSMQIEYKDIKKAKSGELVAVKTDKPVRENDLVFKWV